MNCTSSLTSSRILTLGDWSLHGDLARRVKGGDPSVIREAAGMMASALALPPDGVLIPMPSHLGRATDMLLLAEALSGLTGLPVLDILCGPERTSVHHLKKADMPLPAPSALGLRLHGDLPCGVTPLLVDNVIGTGLTMKAAIAIVPSGLPCTIAVDYRRMSL